MDNPMPRPPRLPRDPGVLSVARRVAELALMVQERESTQVDLVAAIALHQDRIASSLEELVDLVRQAWEDERSPASPIVERICRYCGCTDEQACLGGCSWVADDLCSSCQQRAQDAGSDPLGERGYVQ